MQRVGLKAFKPVFVQCISDIKQRERRYDIAHIAGELNNGLRHFDAECRKRKANSKRNQGWGNDFFKIVQKSAALFAFAGARDEIIPDRPKKGCVDNVEAHHVRHGFIAEKPGVHRQPDKN